MPLPHIIPSIEQLRQQPWAQALERQYGRAQTVDALRAAADALRMRLRGSVEVWSAAEAAAWMSADTAARLGAAAKPSLQRVINATGVIVHTNLGRAPLSQAAIERIRDVAAGYCTLEYDVEKGHRGRRDVHAERTLCQLTGAEAAVVVNNNAAAALLVLAAMAVGREVIVSRGELVEIGGGFRVPDVMAQSGAVLREVGTTNRTRAADYAAAVTDRTGLLLRVHQSNFRIEGFTARPSLAELVDVGRRLSIPVAEDLGSGSLLDSAEGGLTGHTGEPIVRDSVSAGADLVFFSGDKLLGGPQAGIIVGRRAAVERIRTHPLMRALRVDKLTYAALEATLAACAQGRADEVPVVRMLGASLESIDARARALAARLGDRYATEVIDGTSAIGGGSAPGVTLPTRLVAMTPRGASADWLESQLRQLTPPVIARIERDKVLLDLRTVAPQDDEELAALLHLVSW